MKAKTLPTLLILFLGLGGIAWWLQQQQHGTSTAQHSGDSLLPDLDLNEIAAIDILSPKGTNRVENIDGTWVLPSLNGYPANTEKIAEEINKLDDMQVGQAVRGGQAIHEDLDLSDDKATRLILEDKDGQELTTVYLGATREKEQQGNPQFGGGTTTVPDGQYVRVGDGEVVLTKDAITGFDNLENTWVEKEIANISKTDMTEVSVSTTNGSYTLAAVGDNDYYLDGLRKGQEIDKSRAYSVLNAMSYLNFNGVEGKNLDKAITGFDRAQTYAGTTSKGLVYDVKVGNKNKDGDYYVSLSAKAAPQDAPPLDAAKEAVPQTDGEDPAARKKKVDAKMAELSQAHAKEMDRRTQDADRFSDRHAGWVYTISSFKAESFVKPLSELVKLQAEKPTPSTETPVGPTAPTAPTAPTPAPAKKPESGPAKPASSKTAAPTPAVKAPPATKPEATKPATKPATKKPAIKKPAKGGAKTSKAPAAPASKVPASAVDFDALRDELKGLKSAVESADKALDAVKRKNRSFRRHHEPRRVRQAQKKDEVVNLDDLLRGLGEEEGPENPVQADKPKAPKKDKPATAGKPAKPAKPEGKPATAGKPAKPAKPEGKPATAGKPAKPAKPEGKPATAGKPAKPVKPEGKPATAGKPAKPAKPEGKPATAGKPTKPAKPTGKPATAGKPAKPAKPEGKPATAGKPAKPAKPTGKPATAGKPAKPAKPEGKPATAGKPTKPAKPEGKPATAGKPAKPAKPTGKPATAGKPFNPDLPIAQTLPLDVKPEAAPQANPVRANKQADLPIAKTFPIEKPAKQDNVPVAHPVEDDNKEIQPGARNPKLRLAPLHPSTPR